MYLPHTTGGPSYILLLSHAVAQRNNASFTYTTPTQVEDSPYGGMAYCEIFPRDFDPDALENNAAWPVYLAQVRGCP
jgi:hypothetical protein